MNKPFIFHSSPENLSGVRVTVVGNYVDGVLNLSVARCSAKDPFIKKVGRDIAIDRLSVGKYIYSLKSNEITVNRFAGAARAVANAVIAFGVDAKFQLVENTKLFVEVENQCFQFGDEDTFSFILL